MLSDSLEALAEALAKYEGDGVALEGPAVVAINGVLRGCAEEARAMEAQIVPAGARVTDPAAAGENVVALRPRAETGGRP